MAHRKLMAAGVIAVCLIATGSYFWLSRHSNEPTLDGVLAEAGTSSTPSALEDSPFAEPSDPRIAAPKLATTAPAKRKKAPSSSGFARRRAVYEAASRADEQHVQALIDEARDIADPTDRIVALEILLLRLLDQNPQAAVATAIESEREDIPHLLATLAAESPDQVWAALAHVGDPLARMQYRNAVAAAWAVDDPERAFASVADLPDDWARGQLMRQLTWSIARAQPELAVELVNTRPQNERLSLFEALADQWARQDPAAAAQWIEGLGIDAQGRLAYRISAAYVAQQREEALAWALRISRSPGRNLWSYMIGEIAASDPNDALTRALAVDNPQQRRQALSQALTAIAARDPHLAISYIDKLPAGDVRHRAVAEVASQIALTQPNTAIQWLHDIEEPRVRAFAASAIANQLAQGSPERTAQLVDRVPVDARAIWLQEIAAVYARTDIQQGIQWVNRYADDVPGLRDHFLQNVATYAPDAAFDLADRYVDDARRDQSLVSLLRTVAQQAPETAARELSRVSDDGARAQAAGEIASSWARFDRSGSRKWALALESGVVRDTALSQLISYGGKSVDDSLELIERIQSPDKRMDAVFNAAMRLAYSDPNAMKTLLRRHPLDPPRQQQIDQVMSRLR